MKKNVVLVMTFALLLAGLTPPTMSDAVRDVSLRTEIDDNRDTLYYLVNTGDKTVLAKVEYEKYCSGTGNTRKPTVREYTLTPGQKVQLGKFWSRSTCERKFKVLEAAYSQEG